MTNESFQTLASQLDLLAEDEAQKQASFVLAELNDLLTASTASDIEKLPSVSIRNRRLANYVAAMIELAAHVKGVRAPAWTGSIAPLDTPVFAVPWLSLRAHLLLESPVSFRRRKIFIDSSIGARV